MQYFIKVSDEFIVETVIGELSSDVNEADYIEIYEDEIEKVGLYRKFNAETREFSEPVETTQEDESISSKQRIEQLEETVGILAEQLAKQTLGI